ncbi:unnamed protein product [Aphanomyces euteiches]|uniref:ChrR-like cupin domain-containing protein n=1 Tax=Aphanomyces euteiches TaxID=100861 RepID=A0A6G0WN02_9STRA|nr:hypothetical protein Ae201684_013486 [Aphanomyces euteiches]KAH9152304.1 hypothetical protein AeRB84_005236 [Aphanomyces euteiches]
MKVNADLSKAALAHHEQITYVPSPSNGVFRGMLDRDGDEVALATTLVRYAPNSKFPAHKHDAGEEFLVLEGTFNDNVGTYPTGTYVRNPIGSIHAPSIGNDGCLILVKLRWMVPEDTGVVVDTTKTSCGAVRSLYHNETTGEHVWFLHLRAGARVESLDGFEGGEEIFVVDGSASALYDGTSTQLLKYSWLRLPPGRTAKTVLHNTAHEDVRIFVMTGHLRRFLSASS